MWEREPSLAPAVEEAWSRRVPIHDLGDVNTSLKTVMSSLYNWKSVHIGSVPKELERKRKLLGELALLTDDESTAKKIPCQKRWTSFCIRRK
jgi:hypothetical protein